MANKENNKITTVKLKRDTKTRLDHLKEFERESYDEVMQKMLFILNSLRNNPEVAQGILKNIDLKIKRKFAVYEGIPQERQENAEKIPQEKVKQEKQAFKKQEMQNRQQRFLNKK